MYIGEVAKQTGASLKAIRHYEALGLLGKIDRCGSYRRYTPADVRLICLIRQAQALGFRLSELKPLQTKGQQVSQPDLLALLLRKQAQLRADMARIQELEQHLEVVIQELAQCPGTVDDCAVSGGVALQNHILA